MIREGSCTSITLLRWRSSACDGRLRPFDRASEDVVAKLDDAFGSSRGRRALPSDVVIS